MHHNAGEPAPSQESGRWHRKGEGSAQYLALTPLGAWAECARYHSLRSPKLARELRRNLWLVFVRETEIADLGSFDKYNSCGLDPKTAVQTDRSASQALADELQSVGFRGVLSPSAALPGVINLTLFGERYEKVLLTDPASWENPDVNAWLPCQSVVEEGPVPMSLCTEAVFLTKKHEGYREWARANGVSLPTTPP